ncbi:MAG: hypothetical protein HGA37_06400 [Lentimicrobium sp.]|nr:hypothetical protein [Lentimicrobium sp.]
MNKITTILLVAFLANIQLLSAQTSSEKPATDANKFNLFTKDMPYNAKANKEFQFLAFFINQGVNSNMYPKASLFNGQLVGRLFGPNSSSTTDSATSNYFEQRIIPFFIYQPKLFNGKAILRASFEIDWTWGDQAYGLSGNKGGAINADQVNIQTQNIELELIPVKNVAINLGLQRLYDTPYNPYRTMFDKMTTTGYRLAYWGTDAVGISARYDGDFQRVKAGYYLLYENNTEGDDDVSLTELVYQRKLSMEWNVGASLYYIRDRGKNQGGVSVFGQGLTSTLAAYNGSFVFDMQNDYKADIVWLGATISRNPDFWFDPFQLTGFFNYNLGSARSNVEGKYEKAADIAGFAGNIRAAYQIGNTINDYVSVDFLYASGDPNGITDKKYKGVITGNTWGMPSSIFVGSGGYLLFPHANVVNRFTPVIADISNMGYGLIGGTMKISHDLIPNRLNLKAGTASAISQAKPQGGGWSLGTEINGSVSYNLGPYMSIEMHGAYLWLGDFFDSQDSSHGSSINGNATTKLVNPYTVFIVYKWLMF